MQIFYSKESKLQPAGELLASSASRLIFISTTRLHYDSAGRLRSYNPLMSAREWAPFSETFQDITILARIDESHESDEGHLIDQTRSKVVPIPFFDGVSEFYKNARKINKFVSKYVTDQSAFYYIWAPSTLGYSVAKKVRRLRAPLIARVMGDSAGVARAILPGPLKELGAKKSLYTGRKTVRLADGVIYVTLRSLQRKYPAKNDALTLVRTNMQFSPELWEIRRARERSYERPTVPSPIRLIAVGSQEQNYKGHDLLIDAVALLKDQGYSVLVTLVGSGRLHDHLKSHARTRNVQDSVVFIKRLGSSTDVARHVSQQDMFVMPSRTEGMPKALLEAMSVGVLSIGSEAGGIAEVLEKSSTFPVNSAAAISEKIRLMIDNPAFASQQLEKQSRMVDLIKEQYSGPAVLRDFLEDFVARFDTSS